MHTFEIKISAFGLYCIGFFFFGFAAMGLFANTNVYANCQNLGYPKELCLKIVPGYKFYE